MRTIFLLLAIAIAGAAGATGGYRAGTGAWPVLGAAGRDSVVPQAAAESPAPPPAPAGGPERPARKVLYYRNPMGLPDTSPAPKKDWMGMDYIAVYEGEEAGDSSVKVGIERVQRVGVRTAPAERRALTQPVRAAGAVQLDERRIKSVTLRFEGYIEKLFANATEQSVREGEPLFRVYSQPLQLAQVDLAFALRENKARGTPPDADRVVEAAMVRMRNLGVPESRIREVRETGANPRTLDWPAPMSGVIVEKKVIEGQRAQAGDELFRIADLGTVWVIAEVPEQDLGRVRVGDRAAAQFRALPGEQRAGRVTFVYARLKNETRTGRVRIELPNPDLRLKVDMYADVTIETGAGEAMAVAVPDAAVIDAGARQVAFVAKGEGRFEPRAVKLGRRGDGYVEILEGLKEGEEIVVAAAFLIDAESNLKAALQGFVQPEAPK